MRTSSLERKLIVPAPIGEVFTFFTNPKNLSLITPPWLHFETLSCSDERIRNDTVLEHRLRLGALRWRWKSQIAIYDPPRRFIDEQVKGPFRRWIHVHAFDEVYGGTAVSDRVTYAVRGGSLIDAIFVRAKLEAIFDYRAMRVEELLGRGASMGARAARKSPQDGS